jgi:hypothetical protein
MTTAQELYLYEVRCGTCAMKVGYARHEPRMAVYCSTGCENVPMSKVHDNQLRDELLLELHFHTTNSSQIGRELGMTRQQVEDTIRRRITEPRTSYQQEAS